MPVSPIGSIPPAARFQLKRHQIAQVICQIRFSSVLRIAGVEEAVIPFQEAIRHEYPRYVKQHGMSILLTPDGVQQQQTKEFQHRFHDTTGRYAVTLSSDFIALETSDYVDIEDFAGRVEALSQHVANEYAPAEITRLGLRFTNEFRLGATGPKREMVEILNQGFLGASGAEELNEALVGSQHVLELAGQGARMLVRHGLHPLGGTTVELPSAAGPDPAIQQPFYLLDIDVFAETPMPFSVDGISIRLAEFNDYVRSFFAWAVQERYRRDQLGQVDA